MKKTNVVSWGRLVVPLVVCFLKERLFLWVLECLFQKVICPVQVSWILKLANPNHEVPKIIDVSFIKYL